VTPVPSNIVIRRAKAENLGDLLRLIDELARFERLPGPDAEAKERLRREATREHPRFNAFIAYEAGSPVAYIVYFFTYSTFLGRPTLFLEDIFVLYGHRGEGIGKELFRHCAEEAIATGCGRTEWAVLSWNERAIEFYEGLGGKRLDWFLYRIAGPDLRAAAERR
jgi:GNAT superfamily N-acetyltransferase